jgi:uncharacterized membrane protein
VSTPSLEFSRRELAFREEHGGFSLILKRNCSISPTGLACVFAALAVAVVAIGVGFAIAGAWLILPFAGLEVLLLAGAFILQARHATDFERIELNRRRLRVDIVEAERLASYEFDATRARVAMEHDRLTVCDGERELELGRHLDGDSRSAFAAELKRRLRT